MTAGASQSHGRTVTTLDHFESHRDTLTDLGNVTDDADNAAAVAQEIEHIEDLIESFWVERAEAFIDEESANLHTAGLLSDHVGQTEGQGQGHNEGLAPRETLGRSNRVSPLIDNSQAQTALALSGTALFGVLQSEAVVDHGTQTQVGRVDDVPEPLSQNVSREADARWVVSAFAFKKFAEFLDHNPCLMERPELVDGVA